ncbi:MAG: hypothetical protein SOT60_05755, partial [Bilifractor sp.]|nr:hypothetical protein [Bilifractor sp.]
MQIKKSAAVNGTFPSLFINCFVRRIQICLVLLHIILSNLLCFFRIRSFDCRVVDGLSDEITGGCHVATRNFNLRGTGSRGGKMTEIRYAKPS